MKIIRQITQADRCELRATPHAVVLAAIASSVIGAIADEAQELRLARRHRVVNGIARRRPAAGSEARAATSSSRPWTKSSRKTKPPTIAKITASVPVGFASPLPVVSAMTATATMTRGIPTMARVRELLNTIA